MLDRNNTTMFSNMSTRQLVSSTTAMLNHSTTITYPQVLANSPAWGYMSLENVRPVNVGEELELNQYTVLLYGCIIPIFAILTLCTNSLVCAILTSAGMRNATASLLVAIALSEMAMALFPVPPFVYFFTLGNYVEWVPYHWCYASIWLLEFLPTISHGTMMWLTVALAGQRHLTVCKPFETQKWCVTHSAGAILCSIVIFLLVMGSHLSRIFESNFSEKELPSRVTDGKVVIGCNSEFVPFVSTFTNVYFRVYYFLKTLSLHVIPCSMVVYLYIRIIYTKIRRKYPSDLQDKCTYKSRLKMYLVHLAEAKYSTGIIMGFLTLFLIVEIPLTVFYGIELVQNKVVFEFDIIGGDILTSMILFANLSTVLACPIKFLIYVTFSTIFRERLKLMLFDLKERCKCNEDEDEDILEN